MNYHGTFFKKIAPHTDVNACLLFPNSKKAHNSVKMPTNTSDFFSLKNRPANDYAAGY